MGTARRDLDPILEQLLATTVEITNTTERGGESVVFEIKQL
jgi:hypothetical protein